MSNTLQNAGKWDQFKGDMKKLYGELTDQELEYGAKGNWDKLKGWAKEKLGDAEQQKAFNDQVDAYRKGLEDGESCSTTKGDCGCSGKSAA